MSHLENLSLIAGASTDLSPITKLTKLKKLNLKLANTRIDEVLVLRGLTNLRDVRVNLCESHIALTEVRKLMDALPYCEITHWGQREIRNRYRYDTGRYGVGGMEWSGRNTTR